MDKYKDLLKELNNAVEFLLNMVTNGKKLNKE
jgi:hypothetical protein